MSGIEYEYDDDYDEFGDFEEPPVPSDFDEDPSPPRLTVVPTTSTASTYNPLAHAQAEWMRYAERDADGHISLPPLPRLAYELALARSWPVEWSGQVFALQRTALAFPSGGVLFPLSARTHKRVAADVLALGHVSPPPTSSIKRALDAWEGAPHQLDTAPWTRWGRSADGALWWDSGRPDGGFVRLDARGWSIESEPDCWFVRPSGLAALPLPTRGGRIGNLWDSANVAPEDRRLVVSWLLASMLPDPPAESGMLYITGPAGAGKSTAMTVLSEAAGGEPNRKTKTRATAERDLAVVARDGWVLTIDNVSSWTAEESDHLCTLLTGGETTVRRLYTMESESIRVRRPAIATAIDVPVLREDLVRRMVPVVLSKLSTSTPGTSLMARWRQVQPGVFGALLDLMVQVEALGPPPSGTDLSTMPGWGRMAWALDQLVPPPDGISTVRQCVERQVTLSHDDVLDDPFWEHAAYRMNGTPFKGTLTAFLRLVGIPEDPRVDTRSWPTARALPGRIERHSVGLRSAGWVFEKQADSAALSSKHAPVWCITPPPHLVAGTLLAANARCAGVVMSRSRCAGAEQRHRHPLAPSVSAGGTEGALSLPPYHPPPPYPRSCPSSPPVAQSPTRESSILSWRRTSRGWRSRLSLQPRQGLPPEKGAGSVGVYRRMGSRRPAPSQPYAGGGERQRRTRLSADPRQGVHVPFRRHRVARLLSQTAETSGAAGASGSAGGSGLRPPE